MANHEQVDIGDEDELFSEMLTGDAPSFDAGPSDTGEEPAALEPEKSSRERDEFGRFKSKAQDAVEQPAEAEPQTQVEAPVEAAAQDTAAAQASHKDDDGGQIPSWRMREIREARDAERARAERAEQSAREAQAAALQLQRNLEAMQRQIQHFQNPPKQPDPIDLFGDNGPERFVETIEERLERQQRTFQQEIRNVRLESNFAMTHQLNPEVFPEAYKAFEQAVNSGDKVVGARVFNSPNPGAALVAWHKEQSAIKEIGGDPNAYVQRKLDEALKDPAFLAKALEAAKATATGQPAQPGQPAPRPNTVTQLPPSLRSVPGAASQSSGLESLSDEELFNSIAR
jgi:hypothetical protein